MTNGFDEMILNMTDTTPEPEDYTGEDGLLYCGKCHKPKEGYFPKETAAWLGRDRHRLPTQNLVKMPLDIPISYPRSKPFLP